MAIVDTIFTWFVNSNKGLSKPIDGLPSEYPASMFNYNDEYGVMIPVSNDVCDIQESFSNVYLAKRNFQFDSGKPQTCLVLSCKLIDDNFSKKFASVCEDFVYPGPDGLCRKQLMANPFDWWSDWRKIIGNKESISAPYDVLGEMICLDLMVGMGENPVWEGQSGNTIDIRGTSFDCEVKSTIVRNHKEVTISSSNQLDDFEKELHLYHCCFQQSVSGINIDDMFNRLVFHGMNPDYLEAILDSRGFKKGKASRATRYEVISIEDYTVDETFPKITSGSFKNNSLPVGILSLSYVVSLSGLDFKALTYR